MKTARSHRARKSGSANFERSRRLPASLGASGSIIEIGECTAELGKFEMESVFQKSLWPAPPPGEGEMWLGAHEERADVGGPGGNWRAPRPVQFPAQLSHELGVRYRVWGGDIEDARNFRTLNGFDEHAHQIGDVDPAHVLLSRPDMSAEE